MSEFTAITTQEEFDERIKNRLERERKTISEKYSDYDSIKESIEQKDKEIAELNQSLTEEASKNTNNTKTISELQAKVRKYESDSAKTRVAQEYGIPYELAGRLTGDDEEALKKDAENLSKIIKGSKGAPPLRNNEKPEGDEKREALKNMLSGIKDE